MEGEVCFVHGALMVIDYGIGAGADSIMLFLATRGENLVNCQRQLGTARVQLYWMFTTENVFSSVVLIFKVLGYFW